MHPEAHKSINREGISRNRAPKLNESEAQHIVDVHDHKLGVSAVFVVTSAAKWVIHRGAYVQWSKLINTMKYSIVNSRFCRT